jgi:hypothetical protein
MKSPLRRMRERRARKLARAMRPELERIERTARAAPLAQVLLAQRWRDLAAGGGPLPTFREVGFRCHSQFDEDGILLYLFSLLGTTNRVAVEICAGDGIECNAANLILNHGWHGVLFDGAEESVARGRRFYERHPDTWIHPPRFVRDWVTAENVDDLIRGAGVEGEIDLLSIDIDGMDYWIWKAIDIVRPRVVVCETHNIVPAELAITVPYDPHFEIRTPDFRSASPAAIAKLAAEKGYRLVGVHRLGFNAFYVRGDLGADLLPEVSVASCLEDPYSRRGRAERWPKVKDMGWVEV